MLKKSDLRSDQDRVITHLFENDAVQVIVPMGGGKTVDALTAIREQIDDRVRRHALVLAPKRVAQLVWPAERGKWEHLQDTTILLVDGTVAEREAKMKKLADVHVVGIDNTQWLVEYLEKLPLNHWHFDLLVIDELSRFKNPRSKRAKALKGTRKKPGVIHKFGAIWGFTGTPRPNGYEDQYNPLQIITKGSLWHDSFDVWQKANMYPDDYARTKWLIKPPAEPRIIADINRYTIAIGLDEMPELPELTYVPEYVELPPEIMKEYKRMERECFSRFDEREIGAVNMAVATGKLAQIAQGFMYYSEEEGGPREVQWLHSLKGDWLADKVDSLNGAPLLIAYEFQEDLDAIRDMYPGIPWLGQGTTDKQAFAYERDWNAGKLELLAMHPYSAGHGLNLQDGGSQMALYGLTWSSEAYDQMIKRFHRTGQKRKSFAHLCLARNTVDEMKYMRVHDKMTQQDAFKAYIRRV